MNHLIVSHSFSSMHHYTIIVGYVSVLCVQLWRTKEQI